MAGLTAISALTADSSIRSVSKIDKKGKLSVDGIELFIHHFDKDWKGASQINDGLTIDRQEGNLSDYHFEAKMPSRKNVSLKIEESIRQESSETLAYKAIVTPEQPLETSLLSLNSSLKLERFCGQTLLINGSKELLLPVEFDGKTTMLFSDQAKSLQIPGMNGKIIISGEFNLQVQDERNWNHQTFSIRIAFNPSKGLISRSDLNLSISYIPYKANPVNLKEAVNMGFRDETPNDQKGGWTDQGSKNDLSMLKAGIQNFGGIDFEIIDPSANNGKSCILLSGPDRYYFPENVEVKTKSLTGSYLYLLHAMAWPPAGRTQIGKITVAYADGKSTEIPVTGNLELGNWWEPAPRPNGLVVWTGENKSSYVGLYRSVFKIDKKEIKSIRFDSNKNAVWGIVAASVSDDMAPLLISMPSYITAGKEWKEIPFHKDIKKGSVLDFSSHLDAPAGKYGAIIVKDGKFVFEKRPDIPVRFYGTNLVSTAPFLDKKQAELIADRLAAAGYNAVRIHHHDTGISDSKNGRTDLNLRNIDKLDYLIYCLKERGIYITTDLFVSRIRESDEIPEFPGKKISMDAFKALAFLSDDIMKNFETFSANWMNHVNPYTKMALKDDPVLISLSLINEDNIGSQWKCEPWIAELYQKRFAEWVQQKGLKVDDPAVKQQLFTEFLVETYDRAYQRMKKFVRNLGVKAVICDQNMQNQPILALMRKHYDYVDTHGYWDHPRFPAVSWQLPSSLMNISALAKAAEVPAKLFPSRIYGMPLTITEFDFARPNFYRAEGPLLYGAYAGLQDWDGLVHFAYSHRFERMLKDTETMGHFDGATDIVKDLSQRIGIALFLWKQVKASDIKIGVPVTSLEGKDFSQAYPDSVLRLGLIAQVGTLTDKEPDKLKALITIEKQIPDVFKKYPAFDGQMPLTEILNKIQDAKIIPPKSYDEKEGIYRASTGEIELNSKVQTFKAVTTASESFILPEKQKLGGNFVSVDNQISRAVISLISTDGKALKDSKRILILHLTDTQPNKLKFGNREMTLMETWGETPFLAKKGLAELTIDSNDTEAYQAFAVTTSGERLHSVSIERNENGKVSFKLDTFAGKEPALAYELIRK